MTIGLIWISASEAVLWHKCISTKWKGAFAQLSIKLSGEYYEGIWQMKIPLMKTLLTPYLFGPVYNRIVKHVRFKSRLLNLNT
jgi:hypothetical protein